MAAQRQDAQPRTYTPTWKAVLSLPFRICNPPPAVGKVRSCGVTPLIKIRLEDVLDRKHLPPIGLKDFEDYTMKYRQWEAACKAQTQMAGKYGDHLPARNSSHLSMFYARAKQTFFVPHSTYELDLPSDILAPFHASDLCPHPDPIIFHEVSKETQKMLEKCLGRFVSAQLNNVGTNRVLCGIIAGTVFCLLGAIPPLAVNFAVGHSRWMRLAAFPGMWIGLTILLAALNGICMGVYIFGDLRQLHKFELERPPISKPRPMSNQPATLPVYAPPPPPNMVLPLTQPPRLSITPPSPAYIMDRRLSHTPTITSSSSSSRTSSLYGSSSGSSNGVSDPMIEISAAYYDTDPVDGPATTPIALTDTFTFPAKTEDEHCSNSIFINTAGFIHPYDSTLDLASDYGLGNCPHKERQPISPFDFDALPLRPSPEREILEIKSQVPPLSKISPTTVLEQIQFRCNIKKWLVVDRSFVATQTNARTPCSSFGQAVHDHHNVSSPRRLHPVKGEAAVRKQFKAVKAVPAFSSLTRVLSPVVVRGQWEIVVRSAVIALIITWIVLGSLLAVPIPH
ncbi:hypothetical protein H0H81_001013 [Sphagnurus paluster]|uniref:Uncharacterized protein n=1 Tax=Sphagnurus paluster TaxID=117069 RepID=A0A9P7FTU7_9AGAR|nr:hypothetical protein H0H81_001013 [Sphagnurus paluster]